MALEVCASLPHDLAEKAPEPAEGTKPPQLQGGGESLGSLLGAPQPWPPIPAPPPLFSLSNGLSPASVGQREHDQQFLGQAGCLDLCNYYFGEIFGFAIRS